MNPNFFQFEADFVDSLRCIPMGVRFKLDTCGVKLKLAHWHRFTAEERQSLVEKPCSTNAESLMYKEMLQNLVTQKTQAPAQEIAVDQDPPWLNATEIPDEIQDKASEFGVILTLEQWSNLNPLQRFALIKLSRPSHENKNFYPAILEFGLENGSTSKS